MGSFIPGSRANFIFDFVTVAMILVLPLLFLSVGLAKRKKYQAHKLSQIILASVLGIVIIIFEIDIRIYGWRHLAAASPYYGISLFTVLIIHLFFSISTLFLWIGTVYTALTRFSSPPTPGEFSAKHKRLGKMSVYFMTMTAVTGWLFYYMAFIA